MSSYAASLLDELMGRNRNANTDEEQKDLNWEDPEVCKCHLCGFCPHELFTNTRADLGPCYKIHDEELARNYKHSTRLGRMGYENDFLDYLETLITDVDRRIKRGQARLALSAQHQAQQEEELSAAQETRMRLLTEKINTMLEETEKLGCEGKVDEAQDLMQQTEKLRNEKMVLEELRQNRTVQPPVPNLDLNNNNNNNSSKEMEVCTICGAFLVVGDAIQRIEEHLQGKQHLGYMKIREKIDDIKKSLKGVDSERETRLAREREEREKEKALERERERRKSRDEGRRKRSRSRSKSRSSRDKHSRRHRHESSKHRSHSKSSKGKARREEEEEEDEDGERRRRRRRRRHEEEEEEHKRRSRDGRYE